MIAPIVSQFREGLASGQLLVQKCNTCEKLNMYPRHACPFCQSRSLGWQCVSGNGKLHSYTVLRAGAPEGFESDLPYAMGVVKLDEGVQLMARLEAGPDGEWGHYSCDDRVRFAPVSAEEIARRPCAWFTRA
jgi:uncharacterized OB-fold protein